MTTETLYRFFVFDIDGTITKSKAPIDDEMAALLVKAIEQGNSIGFLSGASITQIKEQITSRLKLNDYSEWPAIWAGATCGAKIYQWSYEDGLPNIRFEFNLSDAEKGIIVASLEAAMAYAQIEKPVQDWGPIIEDRGAQITFSGLGQAAPIEAKKVWDVVGATRASMLAFLSAIPSMSNFSYKIGGSTSIDISRKGIDKESGMLRLLQYSGFIRSKVVYFGDAFDNSGNDSPVLRAGVPCVQVRDVEHTKELFKEYL